jgi:hypothetical protein
VRDQTKVIIGFGSIWGLFALGVVLISSFMFGSNDTVPEIAALVLYGLTILPACILAIWYRRGPAWWLIVLSFISIFGSMYQVAQEESRALKAYAAPLLVASIPGIIGILLLRSRRGESSRVASSPTDRGAPESQ